VLINSYGPTEAVITPLTWHVTDASQCQTAYAPIGRAIGARRAYVLDADLNLSVPGVIGELYVSGESLARGYLDRPGLTAERFVPDPFAAHAGARMYRTGDLVRVLASGDVEFVGRSDHQVKLRGYRVEPGEIEAQILDVPGVREAIVVAQGGAAVAQRLVAYVVGDAQPSVLRAQLAAALPAHMVPSHWVLMTELPRTANGKIDRKQLPEPEAAAHSFSAPETAIERKLAAIWQEVLEVARVGLTDNFFALGGHSLLVMRVVTRVQADLGVELAVRELFETDDLRQLAALVERSSSSKQGLSEAVADSLSELENMSEEELAALLNESEE
jgi:acyl carrier protein